MKPDLFLCLQLEVIVIDNVDNGLLQDITFITRSIL